MIDNGIATVTQVLAPLTGGLSLAVGNALLGPFFQSVTNGAEVVLSNLIGAPVDFVADGAAMALTRTLGNLSSFARQYNVKTDRLDAVNNQLKTLATKPAKGNRH